MRRIHVAIGVVLALGLAGCELITSFDGAKLRAAEDDASADAGLGDDGAAGLADAAPSLDAGSAPAPGLCPSQRGAADAGRGSPDVVTVVMVDPDGNPVVGASVTFSQVAGTASLSTGADGTVALSLPVGGSITAGGTTVFGVANGDLIHVGPEQRGGLRLLYGNLAPPANLGAGNLDVAAGGCGGYSAVGPGSYSAQLIGHGQRCVLPNNHVGATFIALDTANVPFAAAWKDAIVGLPTDVAAEDWLPLAPGVATVSGAAPAGFLSGPLLAVDFPCGLSHQPGIGSGWGADAAAYYLPPAALAPTMLVRATLSGSAGGAPGFVQDVASLHERRMAAMNTVSETLDAFLPRINSSQLGGPTVLAAPLPSDGVGVCGGLLSPRVVFPIGAGATDVHPPGGAGCNELMIIVSPQLTYARARQFPTALIDPDSILDLILPDGDAEVFITSLSQYNAG